MRLGYSFALLMAPHDDEMKKSPNEHEFYRWDLIASQSSNRWSHRRMRGMNACLAPPSSSSSSPGSGSLIVARVLIRKLDTDTRDISIETIDGIAKSVPLPVSLPRSGRQGTSNGNGKQERDLERAWFVGVMEEIRKLWYFRGGKTMDAVRILREAETFASIVTSRAGSASPTHWGEIPCLDTEELKK